MNQDMLLIGSSSTNTALMHELSHRFFHLLFQNNCYPYSDDTDKKLYQEAIKDVLSNIAEHYGIAIADQDKESTYAYGKALSQAITSSHTSVSPCVEMLAGRVMNVYKVYKATDEYSETAVRALEIRAAGCYTDEVAEILAPYDEYWAQVVEPAMERYIEAYEAAY